MQLPVTVQPRKPTCSQSDTVTHIIAWDKKTKLAYASAK